MASINRKSLSVSGISVAIPGVVANLPRTGSELARGQAPMYLSFTRHLWYSDADMDTAPRQERPDMGADHAAKRAGRSGCSAGVLHCRGFARFAKPAIPLGWASFGRTVAASAGGDPGKVAGLEFGPKSSSISLHPPKRTLQGTNLNWPSLSGTSNFAGGSAASWSAKGMLRSAARGK